MTFMRDRNGGVGFKMGTEAIDDRAAHTRRWDLMSLAERHKPAEGHPQPLGCQYRAQRSPFGVSWSWRARPGLDHRCTEICAQIAPCFWRQDIFSWAQLLIRGLINCIDAGAIRGSTPDILQILVTADLRSRRLLGDSELSCSCRAITSARVGVEEIGSISAFNIGA